MSPLPGDTANIATSGTSCPTTGDVSFHAWEMGAWENGTVPMSRADPVAQGVPLMELSVSGAGYTLSWAVQTQWDGPSPSFQSPWRGSSTHNS